MLELIRESRPEVLKRLCSEYQIPESALDEGAETVLAAWSIHADTEIGELTTVMIPKERGCKIISLFLQRGCRTAELIRESFSLFFKEIFSEDCDCVSWRIHLGAGQKNSFYLLLKSIPGICAEDRTLYRYLHISSEKMRQKKAHNPSEVSSRITGEGPYFLKKLEDLGEEELSQAEELKTRAPENLTFLMSDCDPRLSVVIEERESGRIVGWILIKRLENGEAEIRRAFVFPEYRSPEIWVGCFSLKIRQLVEEFPAFGYRVEETNPKMYKVMEHYFRDSLTGITEEHCILVKKAVTI